VYSNDKAYPYPQIVTGDSWDVYETTDINPEPDTDNLNKKMYVPLDRHCALCGVNHSRMIRRKQLGYAKWSPATRGKLKPGTRKEAVDVLESVRVNYLLSRADKPINEPTMCMDIHRGYIANMIKNMPIANLLLYGIDNFTMQRGQSLYNFSEGTDQVKQLFALLEQAQDDITLSPMRKAELNVATSLIQQFARAIMNNRAGQTPSYRKVQKQAAVLSKYLDMFMDPPEPYTPPVPQPSSAEGEESEESDDGEIDGTVKSLEDRMRNELLNKMNYHSGSGIGYWGKMNIHTPPLTVNLQSKLKGSRQYRPMDYGYNPKYINRFCIDKKIFKQKLNVKGGTILIDASGSMNFNSDDILEIMKLLPAVNIAMYNGSHITGDLHIIAQNGKRVTDTYLYNHSGGGNVVDGPALEWLATMPARRIWVSDMYVFGATGDTSGFNLLKECYDICTKHKIINLKDIDEVKEYALKLNQ
tara:strand:+ start:3011 stop:4423 length:1413 start_codon:yes stop_codon:yes gene_type:complete